MAAGQLLIVLDDLSCILLAHYAQANTTIGYAATPNLDALAKSGKRGLKYITHTLCTPSRASMLTGLLPFRTGLGKPLDTPEDGPGLSVNAYTLPRLIRDLGLGHTTAHIGKSHVGEIMVGETTSPAILGFDHSVWVPANPANPYTATYFVNGEEFNCDGQYLTEIFTNAASEWINSQIGPYFLWFAPPLIHGPWVRPPAGTYNDVRWVLPDEVSPVDVGPLAVDYVRAMLESIDFYIGQLLAAITPDLRNELTVWIVSDNGTPGTIIENEVWAHDNSLVGPNHGKRTAHRGGIESPLIVNGPKISPGTFNALVQTTDIYRTIAEACNGGMSVQPLLDAHHAGTDSASFLWAVNDEQSPPGRRWIAVSEVFSPNGINQGTTPGVRCVTDGRFKLIWHGSPAFDANHHHLFDIQKDPGERVNLIGYEVLPRVAPIKLKLETYLRQVYS